LNLDEFSCFSLNDSLTESSLVHAYHWHTARHTLDRCHTEVLIHRDIDIGDSSSKKRDELIVSRCWNWIDIGISFTHREDTVFFWVVGTVSEYQVLLRHILECLYYQVNTLRWREARAREIVGGRR
jgi:hypothetical protein